MEEFKISKSLEPGKYVSEKGIEIEFSKRYNGIYSLSIGGITIDCRSIDVVIDKIKKIAKYLKKV